MLSFFIAGLAVGALYAISSMALVITYNASRVFNFAQGGMAFFLAYIFYWLGTSVGVPLWLAAIVVVLVIAPLLGLFLWWILLGKLGGLTPLTKVAVMIGLQVALVATTSLIFGSNPDKIALGPVGNPEVLFTVFDVNISNEQLIILLAAGLISGGGFIVLNKTMAGVITRGAVDSELMTSLTGTNPKVVVALSWAVGTSIVGLAGVLIVPKVGLSPVGFATLVSASVAGAIIGKFTMLWRAFFGALLVGIVQEVSSYYLPSEGFFGTSFRPALPFLFMVAALLIYSRQKDVKAETAKTEVAATNNAYERSLSHYLLVMRDPRGRWDRWFGWIMCVIALLAIGMFASEYWIGLIGLSMCFSVVFLSYRLVTGEAGIISLSQISFAGIGALAGGYILQNDTIFGSGTTGSVNPLLAMFVGAFVAGIIGTFVGLLALPLGPLYAAITTFAFGLLVDEVVYTQDALARNGSGLIFMRPTLGNLTFDTWKSYYWFVAAVMFIVIAVLWSLRRSTSGLVFATIRASRVRAATLGFDVFITRVGVFALGAAVAGLGGTLISSGLFVAWPNTFISVIGLVYFALAVAYGTSSIGGLVAAGFGIVVFPAILMEFLPHRFADIPTLLFGLLAINMVADPIGIQAGLRLNIRKLAIAINRNGGGNAVKSESSETVKAKVGV